MWGASSLTFLKAFPGPRGRPALKMHPKNFCQTAFRYPAPKNLQGFWAGDSAFLDFGLRGVAGRRALGRARVGSSAILDLGRAGRPPWAWILGLLGRDFGLPGPGFWPPRAGPGDPQKQAKEGGNRTPPARGDLGFP